MRSELAVRPCGPGQFSDARTSLPALPVSIGFGLGHPLDHDQCFLGGPLARIEPLLPLSLVRGFPYHSHSVLRAGGSREAAISTH